MAPGRSSQDDARRRTHQPAHNRASGSARGSRTSRGAGGTSAGRPSGTGRPHAQRVPGAARPSASASREAAASARRQVRTGDRPSQGRRPAARSQAHPAARRGRTPRRKPRQPRYWLRWLLVIGVVIAVLVALSYAILAAATWARDTIREQDEQQAAEAVVTVYPDPVACTPEQLEVVTDAPTMVATGAGLIVNATLTNTGSEACLLDVGGASLGLIITSGGVGQWDSYTCPAEPAQRLLLVNAGESTTATLTWDGRVSTGQCTPAGGAPDVPAPAEGEAGAAQSAPAVDPLIATAGTYVLHLELGGVAVTGEHVFIIG